MTLTGERRNKGKRGRDRKRSIMRIKNRETRKIRSSLVGAGSLVECVKER